MLQQRMMGTVERGDDSELVGTAAASQNVELLHRIAERRRGEGGAPAADPIEDHAEKGLE